MSTRNAVAAAISLVGLTTIVAANPWDTKAGANPWDTQESRPVTDKVVAAVEQPAANYIVWSPSVNAAGAVTEAGGEVLRELAIIDGVAATLTASQAEALRARGLNLFNDVEVQTAAKGGGNGGGGSSGSSGGGSSGTNSISTPTWGELDPAHRLLTGADRLRAMGINGNGVTVAIVDTGLYTKAGERKNTWSYWSQYPVPVAHFDAIANKAQFVHDHSGHGSHITAVIAGIKIQNLDSGGSGEPIGMAPGANIIPVKAFDEQGRGSYSTVITALDWIHANRAMHNIRVVNLSFGATPQSSYWNDPMNRAVMRLWQAGVVVVASAGNWGPYAQSITAPGNVPYVITAGAMTHNNTPMHPADDRLASFSSAGPTWEGFVKPDIVAPGGRLIGHMDVAVHRIAQQYPQFATDNGKIYTMSGTSQAAAVVSGAVALMLQANPALTPDAVKCRLMSSSRAAVDANGDPAYSVFQQGAGQINVYDAVFNTNLGCANVGLNVSADLADTAHFGGPARQDADGSFYLVDAAGNRQTGKGYLWNNGYLWNQGYLWTNGQLWNNGYLWNQGQLWSNGQLWNNGYLWSQNYVAPTSAAANINHWVNQE